MTIVMARQPPAHGEVGVSKGKVLIKRPLLGKFCKGKKVAVENDFRNLLATLVKKLHN